MLNDGIRALAPFVATPGTAYSTVLTVPAGKEWTIRFLRAVNLAASASTISVSLGTAGTQEIAFNEVLAVPSASAAGAKNVLGPDFITLPPGSVIQARAGAAGSVRLVAGITERDL